MLKIKPGKVGGTTKVPPSKSQTLRALLFAALAEGQSIIRGALDSPDAYAMAHACRSLGASIEESPQGILVEGISGEVICAEDVIQAGNSGIVLRFLSAVAALGRRPIVITGDASIRHQRPMRVLLDALNQLGVAAVSTRGDGYAPVVIEGPFRGRDTFLHGEDSQPVSALLIAGALAEEGITIVVEQPGELPWVEVTLSWLKRLGVTVEREGYTRFSIRQKSLWKGFQYTVPGDWSSAAFPMAAALVTRSEVQVENLDFSDPQGDKRILEIFREMGASITESNGGLTIATEGPLKGIDCDINDCIDAVTILSVVACYAEGKTRIRGAAVARQKECNRLSGIASELGKMGANITETEDGLEIIGKPLIGAKVASHGDHRLALSLAVAALGAKGETMIDDVHCMAKTYPSFVKEMRLIGATMEPM